MFALVRWCAEPITQQCRLKVKVTIEGHQFEPWILRLLYCHSAAGDIAVLQTALFGLRLVCLQCCFYNGQEACVPCLNMHFFLSRLNHCEVVLWLFFRYWGRISSTHLERSAHTCLLTDLFYTRIMPWATEQNLHSLRLVSLGLTYWNIRHTAQIWLQWISGFFQSWRRVCVKYDSIQRRNLPSRLR